MARITCRTTRHERASAGEWAARAGLFPACGCEPATLGSWIADRVGLGRVFEAAWNILRWPVIVFLMVFAMASLYYFAPDVEQEWKWITPGSIYAVIGWIVASLG
jgi:hypothetical protein